MGSVTAKLMRDAKEARKMGDGGFGGGGPDLGVGVDVEGGVQRDVGNFPGLERTGVPGSEADLGPQSFSGTTTELNATEFGALSTSGVPGAKAASPNDVGTGLFGTQSPPQGSSLEGPVAEPKAWEANIEKAAEKASERASVTRKKRRRSLLTEEEGGLMGPSPTYRRSILGR